MSAGSAPTVGTLRKRAEFLAAARGRRFHTERMTVQSLGGAEAGRTPPLRFGLTVTRKVGHATERNRIKRRLRRAVSEAAAGREASAATDLVVIARRPILDTPFPTLVEDLRRALDRAAGAPRPVRPGSVGARPAG